MATPVGPQDSFVEPRFAEVIHYLRDSPWSFDFFQAVRLLEQARSDAAPLGHFGDPRREVVRIGAHQTLGFPASSIQGLDSEGQPWRMMVNFLGMTGPSGVLPRVYSVEVLERARIKDYTFRDFLDLFNHRAISLFYRAWSKYRLPAQYRPDLRDPVSQALLSLAGLGTKQLTGRHEVEDESFIWYTGLFAAQPRSAVALERLLEDYFGIRVEARQFAGAWYRLGSDSTCTMSDDEDASECLGLGAVVGDEVYDQQARVRLRLGPLSLDQYRMFLPGEPAFRRLRELTRFFSRDQIDFEAQLILDRTQVPTPGLAPEPEAVQLGWTTWMRKKSGFDRDPEDAVLLLQ
jgi:type VI secretion system protein ImpH